jgi:hypothetical protein
MKLTELLNRVTPLPWRKSPMTAAVVMNSETLANHAYACHAANVLPELLAAAKNLNESWGRNLTQPMARLNDAIANADEVDTSNEA